MCDPSHDVGGLVRVRGNKTNVTGNTQQHDSHVRAWLRQRAFLRQRARARMAQEASAETVSAPAWDPEAESKRAGFVDPTRAPALPCGPALPEATTEPRTARDLPLGSARRGQRQRCLAPAIPESHRLVTRAPAHESRRERRDRRYHERQAAKRARAEARRRR